ncbi:MAG: hypothetical protein AM326_01300 [Candidatus Thorarchaeota archaeon SMTZ-45]|nr:MAG: hypothetical protein AM326_01300 [Candidatus Thorarchaeota archaeon SMTZ-45]
MTSNSIPWKSIIALNVIVLVSASLAVLFSYAGIFPFTSPLGLYRLLPGDILIDFVWLYIISVLVGGIVYLATPHLSVLLWKTHRLVTGGKYKYSIERYEADVAYGSSIRWLIVPALASLGLTSAIVSDSSIADSLFVTESFDSLAPSAMAIAEIMPLFFILLLVASLIGILFSPAWLLEDAGVIYERDTTGRRVTPDVQGVGHYYLGMLKGFAGLTTLLTYIIVSVQTLNWFQTLPGTIEVPLLFYVLPVVVVFIAPLLAMAPISITFVLYKISLARNIRVLEQKMKSYESVAVEPSSESV